MALMAHMGLLVYILPQSDIFRDCKFDLGLNTWYSNLTWKSPESTLPEEMYDKWFIEGQISLEASLTSPWSAPGTAPTFGEGCGANGGNPHGCGFGEPRTISTLDFQSYNSMKEKTVNHRCSVKA